MMVKNIVVSNGKGGVGASNTVIAVGDWLARHNWNVLIFDQDRQADISKLLGLQSGDNAVKYLNRVIPAERAIVSASVEWAQRDNLKVIPANGKIVGVESTFTLQMSQQETLEDKRDLREMIAAHVKDAGDMFDTMIVDPPKSGELQQSAIVAADLLIIPTKLDFASMSNTVTMLRLACKLLNEYASIVVLPIGLDGRRKAAEASLIAQLEQDCQNVAGDRIFRMARGIPESADVKKAGMEGKTIFEYAPKSTVALAYDEFCTQTFGL